MMIKLLRTLFQNGYELKNGQSHANLYALKSAVQPGKNGGAVVADVQDSVTLQVEVAVGGLSELLNGAIRTIKYME
jgi:hypothetical protein